MDDTKPSIKPLREGGCKENFHESSEIEVETVYIISSELSKFIILCLILLLHQSHLSLIFLYAFPSLSKLS